MTPKINLLLSSITPKQKKDLLGLYKDYLYFSRGIEYLFNQEASLGLVKRFIEQVSWRDDTDMPWAFDFTNKYTCGNRE